MGFEPTDGGTVTGFQDRLFQPLRHLSKCVSVQLTKIIIPKHRHFVNTFFEIFYIFLSAHGIDNIPI